MLKLQKLSLYTFLFFTFFSYFVRSHFFTYYGCSQEKYQPNTPYESNLNSLLASFVSSSSQTLYNSFAIGNDTNTPTNSAIYGLYQCRGDLRTSECSECVKSAVSRVGIVCPYTYSGSMQFQECLVRYENYDFLGKLDTSLRYKKCSKIISHDVQSLKRRDDVLVELSEVDQGFRVSGAGLVQGFSQCLGDLNPDDCSSCLEEAGSKLESLCGSSEAGDVFLAQCYMRYWTAGYYESPSST